MHQGRTQKSTFNQSQQTTKSVYMFLSFQYLCLVQGYEGNIYIYIHNNASVYVNMYNQVDIWMCS